CASDNRRSSQRSAMATPPGVATTTAGNPPPSEIQTSPNLVQFDPKLVVPTQPIYLQRNDILVFTGITNDLAATIQVNYRYLTPEGEIKEGQYIFQASSPNIFFYFSIFEGWLLSFTIRQTDSVIAGTWSYVQVFVARTPPATLLGVTQGLLWEGYVPYNLSIGWPGSPSKEATDGAGVLRSITGTMPGVGAEISEVVPNQRRSRKPASRSLSRRWDKHLLRDSRSRTPNRNRHVVLLFCTRNPILLRHYK